MCCWGKGIPRFRKREFFCIECKEENISTCDSSPVCLRHTTEDFGPDLAIQSRRVVAGVDCINRIAILLRHASQVAVWVWVDTIRQEGSTDRSTDSDRQPKIKSRAASDLKRGNGMLKCNVEV